MSVGCSLTMRHTLARLIGSFTCRSVHFVKRRYSVASVQRVRNQVGRVCKTRDIFGEGESVLYISEKYRNKSPLM